MKKIIQFAILLSMHAAHADVASGITCSNQNVVLIQRNTYLGDDNSQYSQSLFVLRLADAKDDFTHSALFLNIHEEGSAGNTFYSAKNEKGGFFQLDVRPFLDQQGQEINSADGLLTYQHGPLQGKSEKVKCIRD